MLNLRMIPKKLSILRQKDKIFSFFLLMLFQYLLVAIFFILGGSIPWYLLVTEETYSVPKPDTWIDSSGKLLNLK